MNDYRQLEERLNYTFKDKQLIIEALTHKSDKKPYNNERLEFLGDAVLDLIVGEYLFSRFPNSNEGVLSKIRAFHAFLSPSRLTKQLWIWPYHCRRSPPQGR